MPGIDWPQIRAVALVVRESLADAGLVGWPKTSGSRGIHVNVRIDRRWTFPEVRRAALALARDVEQRAPELATSKWWKEERHGVFIDYNPWDTGTRRTGLTDAQACADLVILAAVDTRLHVRHDEQLLFVGEPLIVWRLRQFFHRHAFGFTHDFFTMYPSI